MCGIVGYTGDKQAAPILLSGLENWNTGDMIRLVWQLEMGNYYLKL